MKWCRKLECSEDETELTSNLVPNKNAAWLPAEQILSMTN